MKWRNAHLTYGLHIHPGESWREVQQAINNYAAAVKRRVCPNRPFGLGLRLSAQAAEELEPNLEDFKQYLTESGMYVFTITGFPYGRFHGTRVKENVYYPDWSHPQRVEYTNRLARILAGILPEGMTGSISTLPITYGKNLPEGAIENLWSVAESLADLYAKTSKKIVLALEPEPDCFLESTDETVRFWDVLRSYGKSYSLSFLGICLDTCHMVCGFEHPAISLRRLEAAGITVPKVQLSAALLINSAVNPRETLSDFAEAVYLHHTRIRSGEHILRFPDLPQALEANPQGEWRVHFHVPLTFAGDRGLRSTTSFLDADFFYAALQTERHLEIETYSFGVMPQTGQEVVDSIVSEIEWVLEQEKSYPRTDQSCKK
jgi:sugar phosphate isomerase/epimerase